MLLNLINNKIEVAQNSLENIKDATIYLDFKDFEQTHSHIVKIYFNGKELIKKKSNTYKIDPTLITKDYVLIKVVVYDHTGFMKTYEKIINIQKYVSFDTQGYERMPQVILDINKRIAELEEEILELKKENNVI